MHVDQELEARKALLHQPEEAVAAVFPEETVGVQILGQDEGLDVHPFLEAQGNGPGAGIPAGRVPVVADDHPRGEARGLGDLMGREGGSQGRDDVGDAGLEEGSIIRVAFDQDGLSRVADGFLAEVKAVQELALGIERRVGRIQVLGLGIDDGPAAEGHLLACQAEDGEDDPAPEPVVIFVLLFAGEDESGFFQERHRDVFRLEEGEE